VAVVLTPVQTKQIRINTHKRNNKNTVQTIQNTVNTSTHITKTPTLYQNTHILPKHPHTIKTPTIYQNTHTLPKHPHYTKTPIKLPKHP